MRKSQQLSPVGSLPAPSVGQCRLDDDETQNRISPGMLINRIKNEKKRLTFSHSGSPAGGKTAEAKRKSFFLGILIFRFASASGSQKAV